MRFSTIFTVASFFSLASFVPASPVGSGAVMQPRQEDGALTVFQTLKSKTDTILPQIAAFKAAGPVHYNDVAPLINELVESINTATASLAKVPHSRRLAERQSGDELADLVAQIVEAVVDVLNGLVGDLATIPLLAGLLAGVDVTLARLLNGLEGLLAEVLLLVAKLLDNVADLLKDLAFDLTLASLGF